MHAEVTVAALEAGMHVLTEARVAASVAEAEAMLRTSKRHEGLVTQIVPAPMSLDVDAAVIELIGRGDLGESREVCLTHTGGQLASSDAPMTWRQDCALSGVNTLTIGIYNEIARRWVRPDPERVLAQGAVFTRKRRHPGRARG